MFSVPNYDEIRELETMLAYNRYLHWVNYEIFSYQWWLLTIIGVAVKAFVPKLNRISRQ